MKTLKNFKIVHAALIAFALLFVSCTKENDIFNEEADNVNLKSVMTSSGGNSVILYAGQTTNVGTVIFDDIDTDNNGSDDALQITYSVTGGWLLTETHLWIGSSLTLMPATKTGNPQIGLFPYNFSNSSGQSSYKFIIPFTALNFTCSTEGVYFVAAHAVVKNGTQTETAWGDGLRFVQRGNWAMYFNIDINCDITQEPKDKITETAFAYGGAYTKTFISLGFNGRWGWSNGPLVPGSYTFALWAGAGNNDLSKGTNVGNVTLNYDGSKATATYQLNAPYKLEEVHLHLGSEVLPRKNGEFTIAPGQYPYTATDLDGSSAYTFNVSGLSGNVYMVAHATVSGF